MHRYADGYIQACEVCGQRFDAMRPEALYCSTRCSNDAYTERRRARRAQAREKTCEVCSSNFTATRADTKTCSPACKQKAYRLRKKTLEGQDIERF